jgi:DNA primase
VRSIVETIAKVPDAIKRALFIQKLGERFHLSEQMLTMELQKNLSAPQPKRTPVSNGEAQLNETLSSNEDQTSSFIIHHLSLSLAESSLLEAMLDDPHGVARLIDETGFDLSLVQHIAASEIISYLMQEVEGGEPIQFEQILDEYRGRPEEQLLVAHGMTQHSFSSRWDDMMDEQPSTAPAKARQAMARLERASLERRQTEILALLSVTTDEHELERLQRESLELSKRNQQLRQSPETFATAS